jgi:Phospholipase_D-nuclease N-terminal
MFAAMLGGAEITLMLLVVLLAPITLAILAFWIWMLIHAAQNKGLSEGEKVAWVLIIVLVHFLGALIYFFVGRPKAKLPPQLTA